MTTWGEFKAGLIDALDDTDRNQPTWSDAGLLRYMNYALVSISEHTAATKTWVYTPTTTTRQVTLPTDLLELGPVRVTSGVGSTMLTPRRRLPGQTYYSIAGTLYPTEFYEWPENKVLNFFVDLGPTTPVTVDYWASTWGPLAEDDDVLGVPMWMEKALEWNVIMQAMAKPGLQLSQLRSYNTKRNSGSPEDNPLIVYAEYCRKQYERILANNEQQDRFGLGDGLMADEQQISDMIVTALIPELQAVFVDVADSETVGIVKGGILQENPLKKRIYVCVHLGDPDDDRWKDTVASRRDEALDRTMVHIEAYEVGGGTAWWRRFCVEWGFFGVKTKEDQDEARRIANMTRGRVERALALSDGIPGLVDALGEEAIKVYVATSLIDEGGGKLSYIWRGKVQFQVLTEAPY